MTGGPTEGRDGQGLEGRTALVTGASGAIGRACAVALATQGARIVVAYGSDEQGAQETAGLVKAAGAEPVVAQADLTDPGASASATRYYSHADRTVATRTGAAKSTVTSLFADPQNTATHSVSNTTSVLTTRRTTPYGAAPVA